MTNTGQIMGTNVGVAGLGGPGLGQQQFIPGLSGGGNPHPALGGQLLPTATAKLDNRQEEV